MVAGLVGGKGEAAAGAALLRYDAVVGVEKLLFEAWSVQSSPNVAVRQRLVVRSTYIDSDEDANPVVLPPSMPVLVVLLGCVVAYNQCVLWQLLVETLLAGAVEEEVEGLCELGKGAQGHEGEERPHLC